MHALNRTVASLIPPIGALIAERDMLRAENSRLAAANSKLTAQLSVQETRSDICNEFYETGFVIIRNAIDPRRIRWFRDKCLQPVATFWSERLISDADIVTMNGYYGKPWSVDQYKFCQHWHFIMDRMLRFATEGTHHFFELLSEPIWSAIASISAGPFAPSVWTTSRAVDLDKGKSAYAGEMTSTAVFLHYDRLYHDDGDFIINVWCPLQDVGEKSRRPSLRFVPAPLPVIVPLLRDNGNLLKPADLRFQQFVGRHASYPVELAAGDVVIFSNWTLHETYITPSMIEGRTSAEIRVLGNSEGFLQRISPTSSP